MRSHKASASWYVLSLGTLLFACSETDGDLDAGDQSGGAPATLPSGGAGVGGQSPATGGGGSGGFEAASGGAASGGTSSGGANLGSGGEGNSGGAPTEGSGGAELVGAGGEPALEELAASLHELFIHDTCTGVQQSQDDTCTHPQLIEEVLSFGGDANTTYLVTLRVRGLFEPTNLQGGDAPLTEHPYFVVGGTVQAGDYSQWQIEVKEPAEVYTLNHYPQTSHTIYQEDFEAPIVVSGGSEVVIRVTDANDRQIDNARAGLPDRQQVIEGVTETFLDGQMLRLDVVSVEMQ